MRQTTLANSIKWALSRPNARWDLVAFDAHIEREMADWMLKESLTSGQTSAR